MLYRSLIGLEYPALWLAGKQAEADLSTSEVSQLHRVKETCGEIIYYRLAFHFKVKLEDIKDSECKRVTQSYLAMRAGIAENREASPTPGRVSRGNASS
jgi:hypothetical protein